MGGLCCTAERPAEGEGAPEMISAGGGSEVVQSATVPESTESTAATREQGGEQPPPAEAAAAALEETAAPGEAAPEEAAPAEAAASGEAPAASEANAGGSGGGGDGAYLVYSTLNEGSLHLAWRKSAEPGALAFGQPEEDFQLPLFKYKGKSELGRSVHKSKKAFLTGYLQFAKAIKTFKCQLSLLPPSAEDASRVPEIGVLAHYPDSTMAVVDQTGGSVDLSRADAIAAFLVNSSADQNLKAYAKGSADLQSLLLRCKEFGEYVEVLSF